MCIDWDIGKFGKNIKWTGRKIRIKYAGKIIVINGLIIFCFCFDVALKGKNFRHIYFSIILT